MFSFTWHSRASVFHLISFLHWHFFPPLSTCLNILKLFVGNAKSLPHKYQITNNQITNAKLLTHKPNWCQQHCSPESVHTIFLPLPPQVFAQPERNTSTWCKTYIWLLRTWYDICAHEIHVPWFPTSCEACNFQHRPHFFLWPGLHSQKPHLWDENLRLSCAFVSYWQWDRGGQAW